MRIGPAPVARRDGARLVRRYRAGGQVPAAGDAGIIGAFTPAGAAGHVGAGAVTVVGGQRILCPGTLIDLGGSGYGQTCYCNRNNSVYDGRHFCGCLSSSIGSVSGLDGYCLIALYF